MTKKKHEKQFTSNQQRIRKVAVVVVIAPDHRL